MGVHMPVELHIVHKKFDSGDLVVVAIPLNAATQPVFLQGNATAHQMPVTTPPPAGLGGAPYVPPAADLPNHNPTIQFLLQNVLPEINQKSLAPVTIFAPFDL